MQPPAARREETTYDLHGDEIEDPYRWLEDGDDADVEQWVEAQNDHADAWLGQREAREQLRPRVEELARTVEYEPIKPAGDGFFQRVRQPEQDHAVLYHREELDGERRELLDPNEWSEDGSVSMNWYVPSPDGTYVAYGVDEGGEENYDVHVLDVEAGEDVEVLENVGRTHLGRGAWKGEGFYYTATGGAEEGGQLDKEFRYHALGTDPDDDLVIHDEFDAQTWPTAATDDESDHVVVGFSTWDRADLYYLDHGDVLDAHGTGESVDPAPLVEGEDAMFHPTVAGDDCYLRTTLDAPNYRLARLDLGEAGDGGGDVGGGGDGGEGGGGRESGDGGEGGVGGEGGGGGKGGDGGEGGDAAEAIGADEDGAGALETVVPEDDEAIMEPVAVTDGRLFVQRTRDVVAELAVHDRDGDHLADVALPGKGSLAEPHADDDADALFVSYESFDHPQSVCRVDGSSARGGEGADFGVVDRPDVEIRADLAVDQEWFESADGTAVPAFVVRRADVEPDGTNPALLYGYGGFDISLTPTFRQFLAPFLEDGGVFAVANLRGGGEFGEEWHHAARRETKQRTFDDVAAAAEHLVDRGWADGDRLACWGGSNGGLTVGAAITQQPDRFAAALCQVPLLDMLRFHTSLLGESWTGEYGNPDDEDAYEYISDYSPYHSVEDRQYPDVLFTTAAGDTRVDPFHARKMAARMQHRARETVVLLKTYESTGHGVGKPISQVVDEQLDQWAFLYDRLGMDRAA